ncbi:stage III sporulation protein AG [Calidifontibacillus oryziterrae]|uniref:stage III sporulation protein AG n=1 Tax=Calidifontibacillus oryziterrae TaxID=1191699 RepID=UPI0002D413CD|nr:stage III sporulation protein AG [Calidifontibacillus oryziterrae]
MKYKEFVSWIKGLVSRTETEPKEKKYMNYLLILLAVGIVFMLISNLLPSQTQTQTDSPVPVVGNQISKGNDKAVFGQSKSEGSLEFTDYESAYENQLKETLEQIIGVDDVTVMINLDATESKIFEKNTVIQSQQTDEVDREGGKRKVEDMSRDEQLVIIRNGDQEIPIAIKTKKPEIRGVLVVAKGVENIKVKQMVVEAVTRVLDVPNHRVSVLPKKTKGES